MKKRFFSWICLLALLLSAFPVSSHALEALDPDRKCTVTLHYAQEGLGFPDLEIAIYRVAKANPDGSFDLVSPYSSYPVNIYGITSQREWDTVSTTLKSYIISEALAPTRTGRTDGSGTVTFSGLETGLYLVMGITAENHKGIYEFNTFLIYAPTPNENGTFNYTPEATPKCLHREPKTEYKVVKLWKDTGYTASRPKEVTVEIYKDGVLRETVKLNASNQWTYAWHVTEEEDGIWTVTEKTVPQHYSVTITESGGTFTVTNTRQTSSGSPPKTGDMFPLWPAVLTMCLSGSLLVILGIYHMRKKK